jgi:hypothetical protein
MIMSGYTKLFSSITDSTIWTEPDATRLVWITMLAMADQNGHVAASVPGLAARARVSLDDCLKALETFKAPDQWSRTKEFEGRRITECDGGWILLNHQKYREKRDADDRREQARLAMQKLRASRKLTDVNNVIHSSPELTQAEADTEASPSSTLAKASGVSTSGNPNCPHDEIIALYHQTLPLNPKVKVWNNTRSAHLRQRWREYPSIEEWSEFFNRVSKSKFLTGKVSSGTRKPFLASLDWLIKPENFAKVLEGKYE